MRGGGRPGAGRKPLLSPTQRMAVGFQCEAAFEKTALRLAKFEAEKFRRGALQEPEDRHAANMYAQIQSIPVAGRMAWTSHRADQLEQFSYDFDATLRVAGRLDPKDEGRPILRVTVRRPAGVRQVIFDDVASDWSQRIGRPISRSTVIRCWEEARAMLRRMASEGDAD